jgi:hypothetical protein
LPAAEVLRLSLRDDAPKRFATLTLDSDSMGMKINEIVGADVVFAQIAVDEPPIRP